MKEEGEGGESRENRASSKERRVHLEIGSDILNKKIPEG